MLVERYSIISIGQGNFYFRLNLNVLAWWPNVMDSNISFFFFFSNEAADFSTVSSSSLDNNYYSRSLIFFHRPYRPGWVFGWPIRMLIRSFSKSRKIWIINKLEKRRRPPPDAFFLFENSDGWIFQFASWRFHIWWNLFFV